MSPNDMKVAETKKTAVDQEEQEAVEQEKSKVDQDASRQVLDIDLDADASGDIADHRLGHAVDPDGLSGQGILQQTDSSAGKCSSDRVTSGDCEENSDEK